MIENTKTENDIRKMLRCLRNIDERLAKEISAKRAVGKSACDSDYAEAVWNRNHLITVALMLDDCLST